jgi:HK97 family phage portal protein
MKIPFTNIVIGKNATSNTALPVFKASSSGAFGAGSNIGVSFVNTDEYYKVYRENADVFACVNEWVQNVGQSGFVVEDDDDSTDDSEATAVVYDILNSIEPWLYTRERIVADLAICGNAYLYKVRNTIDDKIVGLQVIDPRTMKYIFTNRFGVVTKYKQQVNMGTTQEFEPEEIIHIKQPFDPVNMTVGMSPMQPALNDIKTDIEASMTSYSTFKNRAQPSMIITLDDGMGQEEQEKAIKLFREEFKGSENAGKTSMLSSIKSIFETKSNIKDSDAMQTRSMITTKICAAYGVPQILLGYSAGATYNNSFVWQSSLYDGTIIPIESRMESIFDWALINDLKRTKQLDPNPDKKFRYKFLPQTFDVESIEKRALLERQSGVITLEQYYQKVGRKPTPEVENDPTYKRLIIAQGKSAVYASDIDKTAPKQAQ